MSDLVERLRSNEQLPVCPFDRLSPHYWTMPDDKPSPICGQENTAEGPDKCRGADTRIMKEAADEIDRLHVVQAMEQYWHRQYDLAREHIRKIQAAVMALPSDQCGGGA